MSADSPLPTSAEGMREEPDFTPDERDPWFVLDFCEGAIRDAITLEDGLDAATGNAVLAMVTNARQARRTARESGEAARLRPAIAQALYRVREWAPHDVTQAAWGLGPVTTDAGAALNALREAAGFTVKLTDDGFPEFHVAAPTASAPPVAEATSEEATP